MIADHHREQIIWLIKRRAEGLPTEEVFIFIAETKGLLDACRQLSEETGGHPQNIPQWLTSNCRAAHIDTREFFNEINQAVALFTPARVSETEHHVLLGLEPGADREAIKQRYRQLCRRYHPDATGDSSGRDTETFIAITNAYQALMHNADDSAPLPQAPPRQQWRRTGKTNKKKGKQRNILWFGLLALVLVVTSLIIARAYNTQIMMASLKNKNTAFVPPQKKQNPPDTQHQQPPPGPQKYAVVPAPQTISPQPGADNSAHRPARTDQSAPTVQEREQQSVVTLLPTSTPKPAPPPSRDPAQPAPLQKSPEPSGQTNIVSSSASEQSSRPQQPITAQTLPKQKQEVITPEATKTRAPGKTSQDQHPAVAEFRQPDLAGLDSPTTQRRTTTATPPVVAIRSATNQETETSQQLPSPAATALPPTPDKPPAPLSQLPPAPQPVPAAPLPTASTPKPVSTPAPIASIAAQERRTQQQIDAFLRQYSTAYRQKNLTTFLSFFTPDATENDNPLPDVIPVYTQLFAETRTLHLHVDPRYWERHNKAIDLHGRFTIDLTYLNGTTIQGQGDIRFELIEDSEQFLIQTLHYVFDH